MVSQPDPEKSVVVAIDQQLRAKLEGLAIEMGETFDEAIVGVLKEYFAPFPLPPPQKPAAKKPRSKK